MTNLGLVASYSPDFLELIVDAREAAERWCHSDVLPAHALLAILKARHGVFVLLFSAMKIDTAQITKDLMHDLAEMPSSNKPTLIRVEEGHKLLAAARAEAGMLEATSVLSEHLLLAILRIEEPVTSTLLARYGVSERAVLQAVLQLRNTTSENQEFYQGALRRFGRDLIDLAIGGGLPRVVEHSDDVLQIMQLLLNAEKRSVLLLGDGGVGKSSLCQALAHRISDRNAPADLRSVQLVEIDCVSLLVDHERTSDVQHRLQSMLMEANALGNCILVLTHLRAILFEQADAARFVTLLRQFLKDGRLRVILLATPEEYKAVLEPNGLIDSHFTVLNVLEPSIEATITIVRGRKAQYELFHGVQINDDAVKCAVKLSARYLSGQLLPGKALELLDRVCSEVKFEITSLPKELEREARVLHKMRIDSMIESIPELTEREEKLSAARMAWEQVRNLHMRRTELKLRIQALQDDANRFTRAGLLSRVYEVEAPEIQRLRLELNDINDQLANSNFQIRVEVNATAVAAVVAKLSGMPLEALQASDEEGRFLRAREILASRVIGQERAIEGAAKALVRMVAGLKEPNRPIGAFLFLGPTGVGKTELSRALAHLMFGDERFLLRIDMSEFADAKIGLSKLIGSGPGYVGYEEGGVLTEAVRNRPYSLVLLDEVEKAAPAVFNTFLQVLEDGRLTDGKGRTISFSNTLIVMTSNLGADLIYQLNSDNRSEVLNTVHDEVAKFFRPEFRNRITETIIFERLGISELRQVLDIQLRKLETMLKERSILFAGMSSLACDFVIHSSFDARMGARPLLRFLEIEIRGRIAEAILRREVVAGNVVAFDLDEHENLRLAIESKEDQ